MHQVRALVAIKHTHSSPWLEQWACVLRAAVPSADVRLILNFNKRSWAIHIKANARRIYYELLTYCKIYVLRN